MKHTDLLQINLSVVLIEDPDIECEPGRVAVIPEIKQEVFVNGSLFKGTLNCSGLFAETHLPSAEWMNTYYDPQYKQGSLGNCRRQDYSTVYLDTCSCGEPGCAGYWNGVKVHKKKDVYEYVGLKRDGYTNGLLGTGRQVLRFSRENIYSVRKQILSFLSQHKDIADEDWSYCSILRKYGK